MLLLSSSLSLAPESSETKSHQTVCHRVEQVSANVEMAENVYGIMAVDLRASMRYGSLSGWRLVLLQLIFFV
jgi:hypothetical protein